MHFGYIPIDRRMRFRYNIAAYIRGPVFSTAGVRSANLPRRHRP